SMAFSDVSFRLATISIARVSPALHPLPALLLDLQDLGPLQQILVERHELLLLAGIQGLPVLAEGTLGRLREVEDRLRFLPDGRAAIRRPGLRLELGVFQDLDDTVDGAPELIRGHPRPGLDPEQAQDADGHEKERAPKVSREDRADSRDGHSIPP